MKKTITIIACAAIFFSCTKEKIQQSPAPAAEKKVPVLVKVQAVDNYDRTLDAVTVKAQ